MDDLSSLRWLAREVPELAEVAAEVPVPRVVSTNLTAPLRKYITWWIRHPDPRGTFAATIGWRRWLPGSLIVRKLLASGYDGLIYGPDTEVIGHIFYQRRGDDIHGFSAAVEPPFEGRKYSVVMILDYMVYAAGLPGVRRARAGTGNNQLTRHILQLVGERADRLGWRTTADGWVTFR